MKCVRESDAPMSMVSITSVGRKDTAINIENLWKLPLLQVGYNVLYKSGRQPFYSRKSINESQQHAPKTPPSPLNTPDYPLLQSANSLRKIHQQRRIQRFVAAIRAKIHRLQPFRRHRLHQARHITISVRRRTIDLEAGLREIPRRDLRKWVDGLVFGVRFLVLYCHVGVGEELGRRESARVVNDAGVRRRHTSEGVRGDGGHVVVDRLVVLIADVVEVDAVDRDVGSCVAGPSGVDGDL